MQYIDNFLNKTTMYRVVLYSLTFLFVVAVILGFVSGSYSSIGIIETLLVLCATCYLSNTLIAWFLGVQTNIESAWITAFILTLIVYPISVVSDIYIYVLVGFVAMLSKYLLAINKKHIFNPVALSLVFAGLIGSGMGVWWIGSAAMFLPIVFVGYLILKKTRRFEMFFSFAIFAIVSISLTSLSQGFNIFESLKLAILSGPLVFFGVIMLTEPLTTPPDKRNQMYYGALVGIIYGLSFHLGRLYNTPELALILGNVFAYVVSPKDRLKLTLLGKNTLTPDTFEFVWRSDKKLSYKAGQYLEWTLGHSKPDTRGNRRYFTISSSPTEENIMLGIKTYPEPSTFKQKLLSLNPEDVIFASQLAGEFTMPEDISKKMVWIAGGIGVTPFRSMAKYITDNKEKRDVIFFYSNKTTKDIVYKDIFDSASLYGVKLHCVCNTKLPDDTMPDLKIGFIDEAMLRGEVPDFKDRVFYISGPHGMVSAFETTLTKMGVPNSQIKTDFFPGFV